MEFFCYHRDRPGSAALRTELLEAHWSYMDGFATSLIARGPTFAHGAPSGSVHIVDLPDAAAARAFAFDEPNHQAGVYRDVLLRRWRNTLGRTMWDFTGEGDRYLVLGFGAGEPADLAVPLERAGEPADLAAVPSERAGELADLAAVPSERTGLIAYGPLLSDDGADWLGTAALLTATGPDEARSVLTTSRYAAVEVHAWTFGGRR